MPTVRYNARRRTCQPSIRRYSALLGGPATRAARKIDLQRCYTRPTYTLERCISAAQLPLPFMKFSAPHFSPPPSSFHLHHRFSRNFYPGTSTALAKSLCVLDRESYEYLIYDEKYNVTYCKEQNYKRIYFMDLYIYMFRIFLLSGIRKML